MNNFEFWESLEYAIENDKPIDDLIPYDLSGLSFSDYLSVLAIIETYSQDESRRRIARRKLNQYESRRNSIL